MLYLNHMAKALRTLGRPPFLRLILKSVALSLLLISLLTAGAVYGLRSIELVRWPWLDWTIDILGSFLTGFGLIYLFPAITAALVGVFADDVAQLVEQEDYPDLPPARDIPLRQEIRTGLKMFMAVITVNLLALPFVFFVPFLPLLINAWLLGREYFETTGLRRESTENIEMMRHLNSLKVWWAGLLIAFLAYIPVLNLLSPVIGIAFMVHVFQDIRVKSSSFRT